MPVSTRQVSVDQLTALGLTPELVEALNLKFIHTAEEARPFFESHIGHRSVRLAVAGYSAPPPGYEASARQFLSDLADRLPGQLALITSPTCDAGSIDAICSQVARHKGLPIGYVTADLYASHGDPQQLPPEVPKFSLPDAAEYSRATAILSNCLLLIGGGPAARMDFHHAIDRGHRVVVVGEAFATSQQILVVDGQGADQAAAFLTS